MPLINDPVVRRDLSVLDKEIDSVRRDMENRAAVGASLRNKLNRLINERVQLRKTLNSPPLVATVRRESSEFIEYEFRAPEDKKFRFRIVNEEGQLLASFFCDPDVVP